MATRILNTGHLTGWRNLGIGIIDQAIEDLKMLRASGHIKGDKVVEKWPLKMVKVRRKCGRVMRPINEIEWGYNSKAQAEKLIAFFKCGQFEELLRETNTGINARAALERLNLI
jgi:hypothetical protein